MPGGFTRLVKVAKVLREDFQARGIPYERSFTVAYLRRFFTNPLFLPPAPRQDRDRPETVEK